MIEQAALGIAGGAWLAAAVAGLRRARNWSQAARPIALGGAALAVVALLAAPTASPGAAPQPSAAIAAITAGAAAYALRAGASNALLLAGGLLLVYAALAGDGDAATPLAVSQLTLILVSSVNLPAMDAAARDWREPARRPRLSVGLWFGLSLAVAVYAAENLAQRGAWHGATPDAIWLLAAWIASSGGLLAKRGRLRAALVVAAALAASFAALSV
jgi:hypothetical protein